MSFLIKEEWLSSADYGVSSLGAPTSMSSQQYRPLLAVPDRKSHLVKERRASPTKQSVVAPIAAKKPLLLPKEGWPGW